MTYQRNMGSLARRPLEEGLDDGVPNGVEQPEVGARHDHEPERHSRALTDLAAIGPLDPAQLLVGGAQEVCRSAEQPLARRVLALGVVLAGGRGSALARGRAGAADGTARLGDVSLGD